jgi:hypothetical protein
MDSKIHFDQKGKFFTPVVDKEMVPTRIQTTTGIVHGVIHLKPGDRIKDLLNGSEGFIAVTQAAAYKPDGDLIMEAKFLALNTDYVIWVAEDDPASKSEPSGGQA